jgi:hypothetical protein
MNITDQTPIAAEAVQLCYGIEALPASPQQTDLSIKASALAEKICSLETSLTSAQTLADELAGALEAERKAGLNHDMANAFYLTCDDDTEALAIYKTELCKRAGDAALAQADAEKHSDEILAHYRAQRPAAGKERL